MAPSSGLVGCQSMGWSRSSNLAERPSFHLRKIVQRITTAPTEAAAATSTVSVVLFDFGALGWTVGRVVGAVELDDEEGERVVEVDNKGMLESVINVGRVRLVVELDEAVEVVELVEEPVELVELEEEDEEEEESDDEEEDDWVVEGGGETAEGGVEGFGGVILGGGGLLAIPPPVSPPPKREPSSDGARFLSRRLWFTCSRFWMCASELATREKARAA